VPAGHAAAAAAHRLPPARTDPALSLTIPPPSAAGAQPDDRRSAWYAAARRRLGLTEAAWYDPAVEQVLEALARHEPIDDAVVELGTARGGAGFDLWETASDLEALAEVSPETDVGGLADSATVAALSAWADAFIARVHPPSGVAALTGLVTLAYRRVRLCAVSGECEAEHRRPGEAYALVVVGPTRRAVDPLARLTGRLHAGRCTRQWFPGGESACHVDDALLAVLSRRTHDLEDRAAGLARALGDGPGRHQVTPLPPEHDDGQRWLDELVSATGRTSP
jgi:hypothetical protein